ncbi:hypothetical protein LEMLEM_LOCUS2194, partial [Lemmus lemmus]
ARSPCHRRNLAEERSCGQGPRFQSLRQAYPPDSHHDPGLGKDHTRLCTLVLRTIR